MKVKEIKFIERHQLSDGGWIKLGKLGRRYTFFRSYPGGDIAPDIDLNLTKKEAYSRIETALRNDVLEISD